MMKRNILAVIVPALLVAGTANAAEIYNKDGNKVPLTVPTCRKSLPLAKAKKLNSGLLV